MDIMLITYRASDHSRSRSHRRLALIAAVEYLKTWQSLGAESRASLPR